MPQDRRAPRSRPPRAAGERPNTKRIDPLKHLTVILKRGELQAERTWVEEYLAGQPNLTLQDLTAALVYLVRAIDADKAESGVAERPGRPGAGGAPAGAGQFKSYRINVGEDEGLRAGNVLAILGNEGGLDGSQVGRIRIAATSATVELSADLSAEEIETLGRLRFRGRAFGLAPARPPAAEARGRRPRNDEDDAFPPARASRSPGGRGAPAGPGRDADYPPARGPAVDFDADDDFDDDFGEDDDFNDTPPPRRARAPESSPAPRPPRIDRAERPSERPARSGGRSSGGAGRERAAAPPRGRPTPPGPGRYAAADDAPRRARRTGDEAPSRARRTGDDAPTRRPRPGGSAAGAKPARYGADTGPAGKPARSGGASKPSGRAPAGAGRGRRADAAPAALPPRTRGGPSARRTPSSTPARGPKKRG